MNHRQITAIALFLGITASSIKIYDFLRTEGYVGQEDFFEIKPKGASFNPEAEPPTF